MEDPFNGLPNDLILVIFNKIAESKTLCMISMVSTKFAALTFQTKEITIKIPTSLTPPNIVIQNQSLRTQLINFLSTPLHHFFNNVHSQTQLMISMSSPSVTPPYFQHVAKFIAKFSSVETLIVSIPSTNNNVLKWTGRANPSEHFVGFMVVFGNNNNNINNKKEYLRMGCYQLSVVLIGYECLWTIVANSHGNMDNLKCAVIKESQQNDIGKLEIVVDEACMAEMMTSRPEVVRICQRIKTFGIFGQIWDLPAEDDDDGFREIKAVSFTSPTNIRETMAFEVEERKILESFGDVSKRNLVPCFIALR